MNANKLMKTELLNINVNAMNLDLPGFLEFFWVIQLVSGDPTRTSPKPSVNHFTAQFKQSSIVRPPGAHVATPLQDQIEREYITTVLRLHYKFKALKFISLGSHT